MTEKKKTIILLVILALSVALLIYAKTHIGEGFVKQLSS
jgi:hypothetical protein